MEIEFKEIAHLYRWVYAVRINDYKLITELVRKHHLFRHIKKAFAFGCYSIDPNYMPDCHFGEERAYDQEFTKNLMPILRKLSSITAEEIIAVFGDKWNIYDLVHGVVLDFGYTPDQFVKLISLHFDLFGLIDSGQAVDADTLSENPYKL